MSLEQLLSELSQRGIKLSVEDGQLRIRAPKGTLTPELRSALQQSKASLLELLSQTKLSSGKTTAAITPISPNQPLPVSIAQERLWLVEQLQPDSSMYNLPMAFRLIGELHIEQLEQCLQTIVKRHEVLRTNYPSDNDKPRVILQSTMPALTVVNLQQQSGDDIETQALNLAGEVSQQPFDLAQESLIRYTLIRLSQQEHLLVIVVHHMVADGWSLGLIISELSTLYNAAMEGVTAPLSNLPFQYADFAAWQQQWLSGEDFKPQLTYWQQIFEETPEALKLPLDRPYLAGSSNQGRCQSFTMKQTLSQALRDFCQQEGRSQFAVLLASFKALLHCYSGQNDLIVCSPVAGRSHSGTQHLIGYFNNILPLRTRVTSDLTFRALIEQVQKTVTGIYDYPDVPLQQIASSPQLAGISLSRALFVLQSWQNGPNQPLELEGVRARPLTKEEIGIDTADFDLAIFVEPEAEKIGGYIQYKTDLFDASTLEQLFCHWMILLERSINQPEATLAELRPLGTIERKQLILKVDTLNRLLTEAVMDRSNYVAPRNEVEKKLTAIWQDVLKNQHIGIRDNFFELGGKSLAAIELFTKIESTFNRKIPFSKIFQTPTIEKLAALLNEDSSSERFTSLVAIKPEGSKPPLFCTHSDDPSVVHYKNIATYLDVDQPFYALQPPALSGEDNLIFTRIEDMATHFINEIQALQPIGPYFLIGHSGGGLVAYEVARQLENQGDEVAFLGMIDTFAPGYEPRPRLRTPSLLYQLYIHCFNLARVKPRRKLGYVLQRIKEIIPKFIWTRLNKSTLLIDDSLHNELPEIYRNLPIYRTIKQANYKACNSYRLDWHYSGKISLYRSIERPTTVRDYPSLGWDQVTNQEIEIYEIPGHHNTMVHEPNVQILGREIQTHLNKIFSYNKSNLFIC